MLRSNSKQSLAIIIRNINAENIHQTSTPDRNYSFGSFHIFNI